MSSQTIKIIITGVLFLHGVAHIGPFLVIVGNWKDTGAWLAARSWLFPNLSVQSAKLVGSAFWIFSLAGFVAASAAFWGILIPGGLWRIIALISAVVSALGILLFLGTWPTFNTIAALSVNAAVFICLLWLKWPPQEMFGK